MALGVLFTTLSWLPSEILDWVISLVYVARIDLMSSNSTQPHQIVIVLKMHSIAPLVVLAFASMASLSAGHPSHDHKAEAEERRAFIERTPHLQKRCASALQARGHTKRVIERRRGLAEDMHKARGISAEGTTYARFSIRQ